MGKGKNGNLRSADMLSEEELRKMASNGGKKSAEVRKQKKTMRKALEMLLYDVKLDEQTKTRLRAQGITNEDDFNHQMVITRSLIAKAEAGDVQAYNTICAMIGEKPVDNIELGGGLNHEVVIKYVGQPSDANFPKSESELDLGDEAGEG